MNALEAKKTIQRMCKGNPTSAQLEALGIAYAALDRQIEEEDTSLEAVKGADELVIKFIVAYYKKNLFYPSYDEIAEGINIAKATVYSRLRKLEAMGIVIRKYGRSPQYRLINMEFILSNSRNRKFSS